MYKPSYYALMVRYWFPAYPENYYCLLFVITLIKNIMSFSQRLLFFTVFFIILSGLQSVSFKALWDLIRTNSKISKKKFIVFAVSVLLVFNIPFIIMVLLKFDLSTLPDWFHKMFIIPFYIYQGAMFFVGSIILFYKILGTPFKLSFYLMNKISFIKKFLDRIKIKKRVVKFDKSRRAIIASSGVFVAGYAFIGAGVGALGKDDYEITRYKLSFKNLPPELKGTKITLVSDIHSGPYMTENNIMKYIEVVNNLNSDIILISGDHTNSNKEEVFPLVNAYKKLYAPKGIFGTLGNHDYFSDAEFISKVISNESPVKMLRNNAELLRINEQPLLILGSDDTRDSGNKTGSVILDYINKTENNAKNIAALHSEDYDSIKKILIYHKPYIFDEIDSRKFDLIASGHTHGGQVVFAKLGDKSFSIASSVSKYVSGLYSLENSQMYVSRGIGTVGLPIRVNCPPEITQFTLV